MQDRRTDSRHAQRNAENSIKSRGTTNTRERTGNKEVQLQGNTLMAVQNAESVESRFSEISLMVFMLQCQQCMMNVFLLMQLKRSIQEII